MLSSMILIRHNLGFEIEEPKTSAGFSSLFFVKCAIWITRMFQFSKPPCMHNLCNMSFQLFPQKMESVSPLLEFDLTCDSPSQF